MRKFKKWPMRNAAGSNNRVVNFTISQIFL